MERQKSQGSSDGWAIPFRCFYIVFSFDFCKSRVLKITIRKTVGLNHPCSFFPTSQSVKDVRSYFPGFFLTSYLPSTSRIFPNSRHRISVPRPTKEQFSHHRAEPAWLVWWRCPAFKPLPRMVTTLDMSAGSCLLAQSTPMPKPSTAVLAATSGVTLGKTTCQTNPVLPPLHSDLQTIPVQAVSLCKNRGTRDYFLTTSLFNTKIAPSLLRPFSLQSLFKH